MPMLLVAVVVAAGSAAAAVFYVPLVILQCIGSETGDPSSSPLCDFGFAIGVAWLLAAVGVVSPLVGALVGARSSRWGPLALGGALSIAAVIGGLALIPVL